jgi:hypothetical protein
MSDIDDVDLFRWLPAVNEPPDGLERLYHQFQRRRLARRAAIVAAACVAVVVVVVASGVAVSGHRGSTRVNVISPPTSRLSSSPPSTFTETVADMVGRTYTQAGLEMVGEDFQYRLVHS